MCGFIGSINEYLGEDKLNLINHRGPDESGFIEENIGGSVVRLGHVRFSIQDLTSAGSQPMSTDCGNYTIILMVKSIII